ncbi:MAG TPA: hypothetical protein VFD67_10490, partial [Gemmatimonadaceae bacterium]|nr:hypothetical protein [Gemmatimonadaceae bacterium]
MCRDEPYRGERYRAESSRGESSRAARNRGESNRDERNLDAPPRGVPHALPEPSHSRRARERRYRPVLLRPLPRVAPQSPHARWNPLTSAMQRVFASSRPRRD